MSRFLHFHKMRLANAVSVFHVVWAGLLLGSLVVFALSLFLPISFIVKVCWAIVGVTTISQLLFLGCPLTTLENALRSYGKDRMKGYKASFVVDRLDKWFDLRPSTVIVTVSMWFLLMFSVITFVVHLA